MIFQIKRSINFFTFSLILIKLKLISNEINYSPPVVNHFFLFTYLYRTNIQSLSSPTHKIRSFTLPTNNLKSQILAKIASDRINDGYPNNNSEFESLRLDSENSFNLNSYIDSFNLKYK